MKRLLQQVKRGESTVLGYVLLIVLAIGMAAAVYAYLKFQLPRNQPQCPDDVSLAITELNCSGEMFSITLQNKGLFSLNGSYIKMGNVSRVYKQIINCPGPEQHAPYCQIYFNTGPDAYLSKPLAPGESWSATFNYTLGAGEREVEVEPLMIASQGLQTINRSRILCSKAIVSTTVVCT
ncbi:MAG: hypothetical protein AABX53_04555 [Nanoarchaeota archaeon]